MPLPSADLSLYGTVSTPEDDYVFTREVSARSPGSSPRLTLELKRPALLAGRVGASGDTGGVRTVGVPLLNPRLDVNNEPDHLYVDVPPPLRTTLGGKERFTVDNLPPDRRLYLLGVGPGSRLTPWSSLRLQTPDS